MQCLTQMLIASLLVLSLSNCAQLQDTFGLIKATDSYCQVYNKVIVAKGDGTITATTGVKKRILANELIYNKLCSTNPT